MSVEENKEVVRRYVEATGDVDRQAAMLSPDVLDHDIPPAYPRGVEGYRQFASLYFGAFSDIRVTLHELVAEGDTVVFHASARGRHTGAFMGIPPTGREVTFTEIAINRVAGGKIVEHRGVTDLLGVLQQLGAIPTPGHPPA